MLNGQLWIWSDQAVMGPTGGFKEAVNFTKLNAKLHVYECVHVLERSHSRKLCNQKKKNKTQFVPLFLSKEMLFSQRVQYLS